MITFRKHAAGTIERFDSRLIRRARGARAVPRIAAALAIIFAAAANGAASPTASGGAQAPAGGRAAAPAPKPDAGGAGEKVGGAASPEVPIKIYVAGTPEDPLVVARIGDFPTELGEPGAEFLQREFIERFMRDVLGLSGRGGGPAAAALKIALLPQENGREQECSFTFGEVSGRITVKLSERSVFVLVSFADKEDAAPVLRAERKSPRPDGRDG